MSLTPDNFSFKTDDVPPFVVSSSIADGEVLLPPGDRHRGRDLQRADEHVSVSTSDIDLFGEFRGRPLRGGLVQLGSDRHACSRSTTTTCPPTPTSSHLFAGPSRILARQLPLPATSSINFTVAGGHEQLHRPEPVLPLGSLVYQGTIDNVLVSSSDVNTYNLAIDPHADPGGRGDAVTTSMTATVTLISPDRQRDRHGDVADARAPRPCCPACRARRAAPTQIEVTGGPGEYKVQAMLNALVDPAAYGGPPNGSIATAQPIDPYANKFVGHDDRTAVLGALSGGGGGGMVSTDRNTPGALQRRYRHRRSDR